MNCATATDCVGGSVACNGGYCESVPVCGRPFLVDGAACRAKAIRTTEWSAYLEPEGLGSLDRSTRDALAAHWTEMGLMEHASIAAFARFALELLALGAPPALLEATLSALRDETHHARLCFGLASAYAGRRIGPGCLPVRGALTAESAAAVVQTAFLEACVGETCAAIEAAEAAARATDPAVCAVLRRIAADEMRHAELGWRFVRWALDTFGADVRQIVAQAVSGIAMTERHTSDSELDECDGAPSVAHGALPETVRRAVRAAALQDVVLPCARMLLEVGCAVAA